MKNKKEKILFFTNELAIMLKSGLTFTTAIEIILKEEKDKNFKEVLKKIHKNLIAGKSIFESFKNFDRIFGNTYLYVENWRSQWKYCRKIRRYFQIFGI